MKKMLMNNVGKDITFVFAHTWGEAVLGKILSVSGESVQVRYFADDDTWITKWLEESWLTKVKRIPEDKYAAVLQYMQGRNAIKLSAKRRA